MEHNGNWNIAADTRGYWYRVYPVYVNAKILYVDHDSALDIFQV